MLILLPHAVCRFTLYCRSMELIFLAIFGTFLAMAFGTVTRCKYFFHSEAKTAICESVRVMNCIFTCENYRPYPHSINRLTLVYQISNDLRSIRQVVVNKKYSHKNCAPLQAK